jgi:hypothetical protein
MLNQRLWRRLIILAAGLFLAGLVLLSGTAFTHATPSQGRAARAAAIQCSLATLHGTYVNAADGFGIQGSDRVPFALAAWETFDGKGHIQGIYSGNSNGKVFAHQVRFTGTYTVNPDCTATETDKDATGSVDHYDDYTTPDGSLITSVDTDPGIVSASVLTRGTGQQAGN